MTVIKDGGVCYPMHITSTVLINGQIVVFICLPCTCLSCREYLTCDKSHLHVVSLFHYACSDVA